MLCIRLQNGVIHIPRNCNNACLTVNNYIDELMHSTVYTNGSDGRGQSSYFNTWCGSTCSSITNLKIHTVVNVL